MDERGAGQIFQLYLDGAEIITGALAEPAVGEAWHRPSVLEDQLVGGLAGHLARGGVWVVEDYLRTTDAAGPIDFESAAQYFATLMSAVTADDHQAIRDRGAALAALGQRELVEMLVGRLLAVRTTLGAVAPDHRISVSGGNGMRLGDYLVTRVVEQVVHMDDLARSIGGEPWPMPEEAVRLAIRVGAEIGALRHGAAPMVRALYRRGFADGPLPVL